MGLQKSNIGIWEEIYSRQDSLLSYPDETLVRVIHRLLSPQKHRTILDYGYGSGSNMIHLINKGYDLSGVEVSESAQSNLRGRLQNLRLNADLRLITDGKIPFAENNFDVVIAWLVLYYNDWNSFYKAMDEINRVLKPGGVFWAPWQPSVIIRIRTAFLWAMECSDRLSQGKREQPFFLSKKRISRNVFLEWK